MTINNGSYSKDNLISTITFIWEDLYKVSLKIYKKNMSIISFCLPHFLQNIPGCQFIPEHPECIYLDTEEKKWSTKGCKVRIMYC